VPAAIYVFRTGTDVALVSTGPQTGRVLTASQQLLANDISATVVHVPSLKPLDEDALRTALDGHDLIVTAEEHSIYGGLGGLVAEVLTAVGTNSRIERIGVSDTWGESADNDFLLNKHGLSPEKVTARVRAMLGSRILG
jgi:transketolase